MATTSSRSARVPSIAAVCNACFTVYHDVPLPGGGGCTRCYGRDTVQSHPDGRGLGIGRFRALRDAWRHGPWPTAEDDATPRRPDVPAAPMAQLLDSVFDSEEV